MGDKITFVEDHIIECVNDEIDLALKNVFRNETKSFSYQDLREVINTFCAFSCKIFYICYGVLQFFAIWDGLLTVFHHNNPVIILVALLLGFFPFCPFVGTGFGIWGAHTGWGIGLSQSVFIFIIPYFFVNFPLLMITAYETYKDVKRWKTEGKLSKSAD